MRREDVRRPSRKSAAKVGPRDISIGVRNQRRQKTLKVSVLVRRENQSTSQELASREIDRLKPVEAFGGRIQERKLAGGSLCPSFLEQPYSSDTAE